jgi:twitching motility protein PilT
MKESQFNEKLKKYLSLVVSQAGSDLHLSAGNFPAIRVDNKLQQLEKEEMVAQSDMESLSKVLLNEHRLDKLQKNRQVDFSLEFKADVRFRGNMFYQKGMLSLALRLIPSKMKNLKELNLPEKIYDFAEKKQGLFLVVGPNGHGKTTTITALIDHINNNYQKHIITIEDPIEYLHVSKQSLVEQREVYDDAVNFPKALKSCFREAVDVIFVGEMRDLETISTAITAAETGHLIFGTLHTNDSIQTIDRIIDIFPPQQQNQIRTQLSSVLAGVLSQRLVKQIGGGRIPAYEIMIKNNAIENLIRQNQTHQIGTVLETSTDEGMININRSLVNLIKEGKISLEEGEGYASDLNSFKLLLDS